MARREETMREDETTRDAAREDREPGRVAKKGEETGEAAFYDPTDMRGQGRERPDTHESRKQRSHYDVSPDAQATPPESATRFTHRDVESPGGSHRDATRTGPANISETPGHDPIIQDVDVEHHEGAPGWREGAGGPGETDASGAPGGASAGGFKGDRGKPATAGDRTEIVDEKERKRRDAGRDEGSPDGVAAP